MSTLLRLAAVILLCLGLPVQAQKLPTEAFASLPDVSQIKLSPDGKQALVLVKVENPNASGSLIRLFDLEKRDIKDLMFSDNEKYKITSLEWANNKQALLWAHFPAVRYGTPVIETRILRLDVKTGETLHILPQKFMKRLKFIPNIMSNVVDMLPHDDEHILMSMAGLSENLDTAVIKVSLKGKGLVKVIQHPRTDIYQWLTDSQENVRIAIKREDNETKFTILEQSEAGADLRELWQFEAFSDQQVWPLAFGKDKNILYVEALYKGKNAIYKVDLTDKSLTRELVYYNSNYDVSTDIRRSHKTGEVVGVGREFWQPELKQLQAELDQLLPNTKNYLTSFSADENRYIVISTSDTDAGSFLIGDKKAKSLNHLAYRYTALAPNLMAKKQLVKYEARDGLEIEGYVTLPQGEIMDLPTIIFPHGGPISHDTDGFDYWAQFLANRGYAVFQMNFRGSSGYGHDFMVKGLNGWGQAMQDDVEDGTRWLIDQGIANKDKICIVGASYGGYAALMGSIKTPELYQCAVSFAGVTDIEYLVDSRKRFGNYEIVKKQLGSDKKLMRQYSPINHVEKITKPVLLVHGSDDRIVKVKHSRAMEKAMKRADKSVQYVEIDEGDHFLLNNQHRLATFKAIEQFLAEHLPAGN